MSGALTPLEEDLLAALDPRAIAAYQQVLGATLPLPGAKPEEDRAVAFIRAKLRGWGLTTTVEQIEVLISLPGEARLSLARRNAPVPALTLPYSPATPDGGIEAELRAVGAASVGTDDDCAGAIALIDGLPTPATVARLAARGALAQVYIAPDETLEPLPVADDGGGPAPVPVALIGRAAGEGYLALAAAGATPVRLRVEAAWATRPLPVPVATIRGADEPDDYMLIGAPLGSGEAAACLLELGRILSEHAGRLRRGVRAIWWPPGAAPPSTPRRYAERHWDELGRHAIGYVELEALLPRARRLAAWGGAGLRPFAEGALREGGVRAVGWDEGAVAPTLAPFARRGLPALRLAAGQAGGLGAIVPVVARLATAPLPPLDLVGIARAIDGRLRATLGDADPALDPAALQARATTFLAATERLQIALLHVAQAEASHYEEGLEIGGRAIRRLARLLLPLLHVAGDPHRPEAGGGEAIAPLLPGLAALGRSQAGDNPPLARRHLDAALAERNRLLDALGAGGEIIEDALTALRPLGFG